MFDDITALASDVQQCTLDGPITVFLDDDGHWVVMCADQAPEQCAGVAGTYGFMAAIDDIAGDMRQVLRERAGRWIAG
jgi:hypothetical protein